MKSSTVFIATGLLASACTLGATGESGEPGSLKEDLLRGPISFALEPRARAAFVTASVFDGESWEAHPTFLDLTAGTAKTSRDLDAGLWLDHLELELADVSLGAFGLADLRILVSVPHPCDAERWAGADQVDAELSIALDLEWSLITREGTVVPLESQSLAASPLDLSVRRGAHGDVIGLSLVNPDPMWEWAGLLRIEDVMFSAGGRATEPLAD